MQTVTPGIDFDEAWKQREIMKYQKQEILVLSRADLIASKRAAGRERDIEDVRILELQSGDNYD